jgi:hypothetical protein
MPASPRFFRFNSANTHSADQSSGSCKAAMHLLRSREGPKKKRVPHLREAQKKNGRP